MFQMDFFLINKHIDDMCISFFKGGFIGLIQIIFFIEFHENKTKKLQAKFTTSQI